MGPAARTRVGEAWEHLARLNGAATPTVVAVIDTGVMWDHEDLQNVVWTNTGEIPGNGLDDDGNGYIDDVYGFDFDDGDAEPDDEDGHGTHCAGIIAAEENGIGVVGVASREAHVKIMALKLMGNERGTTSGAVKALNYAVKMGVMISSNSRAGELPSDAMRAAIAAARDARHLFVAAAGNGGVNNNEIPTYPCCYCPVRPTGLA